MGVSSGRSPLGAAGLVEEYFIENRTRVLEIAAFLDRLDREDPPGAGQDYRMKAFREALAELAAPTGGRVERIQMLLSDPGTEPLPELDRKSALGAYDHWSRQVRA